MTNYVIPMGQNGVTVSVAMNDDDAARLGLKAARPANKAQRPENKARTPRTDANDPTADDDTTEAPKAAQAPTTGRPGHRPRTAKR